MISNWTFDVSGQELVLHATVKKTADISSILWIVKNRIGGVVDSGAASQRSPDDALAYLRALAANLGIEGASGADLRAVDPRRQSARS